MTLLVVGIWWVGIWWVRFRIRPLSCMSYSNTAVKSLFPSIKSFSLNMTPGGRVVILYACPKTRVAFGERHSNCFRLTRPYSG